MIFALVTMTVLKFREDVYEVIMPTADGQIAVLPNHEPLVSLIVPGVVKVRRRQVDSDSKMEEFVVSGGLVEIGNGNVRLLSDEAEKPQEITLAEAQKALERAETMKASAKDQIELEKAQELIDRSKVRIQIAGLKNRHNK